jgi:hypothetical protein
MMNASEDMLPKAPEPVTLELLIRARQLLEHALGHSHGSSSLDRMISIHGLDNSIEYLLRIVSSHLDIESKMGKNLDSAAQSELAGEVGKFLQSHYGVRLP